MPYIRENDKSEIDNMRIADAAFASPGELNYAITKLALAYLSTGTYNYERLNAVMGALESAKTEFYRRAVVPYEDKKIKENGDVY
jgi:hypothetical protein